MNRQPCTKKRHKELLGALRILPDKSQEQTNKERYHHANTNPHYLLQICVGFPFALVLVAQLEAFSTAQLEPRQQLAGLLRCVVDKLEPKVTDFVHLQLLADLSFLDILEGQVSVSEVCTMPVSL